MDAAVWSKKSFGKAVFNCQHPHYYDNSVLWPFKPGELTIHEKDSLFTIQETMEQFNYTRISCSLQCSLEIIRYFLFKVQMSRKFV